MWVCNKYVKINVAEYRALSELDFDAERCGVYTK